MRNNRFPFIPAALTETYMPATFAAQELPAHALAGIEVYQSSTAKSVESTLTAN